MNALSHKCVDRFFCLAAVFLAGLLPCRVGATPALRAGPYTIRDHGRARVFELAADEFYVVDPVAARGPRRMAPEGSADAVRRRVAAHAESTGEDARLVLYEGGRQRTRFTRRVLSRGVLVRLAPGVDAEGAAVAAGLHTAGRLPYAPEYAVFRTSAAGEALCAADALRGRPGVLAADPLLARAHQSRFMPDDPYFGGQWHLLNVGQNGGTAGIDVNVGDVWDTVSGAGVVIGIIDDGLEHSHPDLASNVNVQIGWDWVDGDGDPMPGSLDRHGTAVAGVAAATGSNGVGVAGAAYGATLVGLRLTSAPTTDAEEAAAFAHTNDVIAVKNNSWGPVDDGQTLEGPGPLALAALADGVANGREGKGTIYVWAGGNGLEAGDDANYDGYANSIYSISVSAIDDGGRAAYYSEPGACHVVTAPSSGSGTQGITTTDRAGSAGYNSTGTGDLADTDYTSKFGGTSSAAPLLSGVVALMLEANPGLGWRDVQEILIRTAAQVDAADPDWAVNGAGFHFNHKYGAGLVDAQAAVGLAAVWGNLPSQNHASVSHTNLAVTIPDADPAGVTQSFDFGATAIRVEHVTVTVSVVHNSRGQLALTLTSPAGTESRLAEAHGDSSSGYADWTFSSVRHWGEESAGLWTLKVADTKKGLAGTVTDLRVDLYGSSLGGPQPDLRLDGATFSDDAGGNGNGVVEPGETICETIVLRNDGDSAAANVTARLATQTPGVALLSPSAGYGTIGVGSHAANLAAFRYRLAKTVACGTVLTFEHVAQHMGEGAFTNSFTRTVGLQETPVTQVVESVDVPVAIEDRRTVTSTNTVVTEARIEDVDVAVRIAHSWVGDLVLTVGHPDGTTVLLSQQHGSSDDDYGTGTHGVNLVPTWFDDEAPGPIALGSAPFDGAYRPDAALSAFDGKQATGTWWLAVQDVNKFDEGTLLYWALQVSGVQTQWACDVFNNAPAAYNRALTVAADTQTVMTLTAADPDDDTLTYITNDLPSHGELSGFDSVTGAVTYTPSNGYAGADAFTFTVADGMATSAPGTVTVTVDDSGDMDDDGLPNEWEWQYGLNPLDNGGIAGDPDNGPEGDPDGDGAANLAEYTADTDPTNADSRLSFTGVVLEGGNVRIDWQGGVQARQFLQVRHDLVSTTEQWEVVFTNEPPTSVLTNLLIDTTGASNAFYRLEVERP
ncbi:MAG: S8 family serine peptidase [Kiritimatiellae bacterium]|nr:S8 family serine peptidase [Kiritimatiellia bacterium]